MVVPIVSHTRGDLPGGEGGVPHVQVARSPASIALLPVHCIALQGKVRTRNQWQQLSVMV